MPRPGEIGIKVKTTTRVQARVEVAPAPVVQLQDAPVVEFFGIPLEGAGDVVFVLDCSGSMAEPARGRLAEIRANAPPPVAPPTDSQGGEPTPPAPTDSASGGVSVGPTPADTATPSTGAPTDGALAGDAAPAGATTTTVVTTPRKIDVAQAELVDALRRLPAGTTMNVLFFNNELEAFAPGMIALEETSRGGLIEFVMETTPTGSTALAPAMRTAFLMNARRIVLLSDGLGNVGGNADAVLRDAREAMRGGVRIDAIGVGGGQDSRLLSTLAGESGGLYQAL